MACDNFLGYNTCAAIFFLLQRTASTEGEKMLKQHIYKDTENASHNKVNARDKAVASGLLKNQLARPLE
jgi:hypothetical protein